MNAEQLFFEQFVRHAVDKEPVWVLGSKIYAGRDDWRFRWPAGVGIDAEAGPGVDAVHDLTWPSSWRALNEAHGWPRHVECLSVLEHCKDPWEFVRLLSLWTLRDTTLHLSVPFIWRVHNYPGDYWRFTPHGVRVLFRDWEWLHLRVAVDPGQLLEVADNGKVSIPTRHVPPGVPYFARAQVVGLAVRR